MRVAVIGAGAAGLAAAKALGEAGLTPVVYEASDRIGGLWVYREQGEGPAYRSLRTNTSKQVTAFSDFPFADDLPNFPARAAVETYLQHYADHFGLRPFIQLGCRVTDVSSIDQGWRVTASGGSSRQTETFDAVMVCSGIFRRGYGPAFPGLDRFAGKILHSKDYRVPEAFAGREVLVVGIGSSAADIAVDLTGFARHVTISVRRGAWMAPREVGGRPLDHAASRLSLLFPQDGWKRRRQTMIRREWMRRGVPPPDELWRRCAIAFDPATAPGVTSDELAPRIASGEIIVRPEIERFEGQRVRFADGSSAEPDAVILATGYELDFPFLPPDLRPWTDESSGLYRLVFSPRHVTLPFIGVCRVHGPILPIVEMQARWAARVLTGKTALPPLAEMRTEIAGRWQGRSAGSDALLRVTLLPYLDEIGAVIGVRPRWWRHTHLLGPLLAGPPVAAQYRLEGPHSWAGAPAVIRQAGAP